MKQVHESVRDLRKKVARPLETRVEEMYVRMEATLHNYQDMAAFASHDLDDDDSQSQEAASETEEGGNIHTVMAERSIHQNGIADVDVSTFEGR